MKLFYDIKCESCSFTFVEFLDKNDAAGMCPNCGKFTTHKMPGGLKHFKAKSPYDYLDSFSPGQDKKIFSGPKVSSK